MSNNRNFKRFRTILVTILLVIGVNLAISDSGLMSTKADNSITIGPEDAPRPKAGISITIRPEDVPRPKAGISITIRPEDVPRP